MNVYNTSVLDLGLPLRTQNALMRAGIKTVCALLNAGRFRIEMLKGIGKTGMADIANALAALGFEWPEQSGTVATAIRPPLICADNAPVTMGATLNIATYIETHCYNYTAQQIVTMLREEVRRHD